MICIYIKARPNRAQPYTGRRTTGEWYAVRYLLRTQAKWRIVTQAEPKHQLELPRYNKTNYNHQSFLVFYFIYFYISTYQWWHWSIRCHARSTSENFHGIAYCCLHETSTVNLQTTRTLNGRDYQLFQYSENLISMIVINHSRYMHTVVSMKQIPSIYSKPELKGRDYPLFI